MENQHYKSYEQAALDILRGKKTEEEKPVQQEQQKHETPQPLSEERVEEAAVHPDALHVKPVKMDGKTKYKVHAVGSNYSSGIKVGEHLSDSELDDFSEMGGKIKHMKEEAEELDERIIVNPGQGIADPVKRKQEMQRRLSDRANFTQRRKDSNTFQTGPKPSNEEVEELDELKQDTLLRYGVKAMKQRDSAQTGKRSEYNRAYHDGDNPDQGYIDMQNKVIDKRTKGINAVKSRLRKEEVEELEEMGPGKLPRIDKKVENEYGEKLMADFKARGGEVKQVPSPALPKNRNRMVARGSLSAKERTLTKSGGKSYTSRMEEVEEDYDQLIEEKNAFELELPEQLTFAHYLDAAKIFTESYDDAIVVADHFFRNEDESLVIEAFTRSDIEDRVKMHQKAGNETTLPKYGMKNGKPYAEYTVTEKDSGKKTKYIHHGDMRRVERM